MSSRLLSVLCSLAMFSALHGEETTPATPAAPDTTELIGTVVNAPSLQAARARTKAASARSGASGRLADPTLDVMYGRVNDGMQKYPMWEATLSQPLPKAGERAADRERAAAAVSMAEADYALMAGEMAADTAMAAAEADTARERIKTLELQIARAEKVLAALDARIASGSGKMTERLALQSNIASMQLMIAKDERMADDALSTARAQLGLPANSPLPAYVAPSPALLDENQSPARRLASAKAAEAASMVRMARASARPMTSVGLRFTREEPAMGNMDTIAVAFMTELPWRSRRYARADERAARAEEAAAHAEGAAEGHRLAAALTRVERAERLATTVRRLADETTRRLDAEYDSFLRSASAADGMSGESTVFMVLDILERQTDARLQVIDAEGAVRTARAELWRYAPASLFPAQP